MSEKPKVVVTWDLDDVIVDGTASWLIDHYQRRFGFDVDPAKFYGTPIDWGVEGDDWGEINRRIAPIFEDRGHEVRDLPLSPGSIDVVRSLASYCEINFEQHIVTGRTEKIMASHTLWLVNEHFKDCFQDIHHTNMFKEDSRSKGEVCRRLCAIVHIDDHIDHCASVIDSGVPNAIVFDNLPWNQREQLPYGMVRCSDMTTAKEEIIRIAASIIKN